MSKFEVKKDGNNLLLVRKTKKGDRKHYLAHIVGPSSDPTFKLELHFMGDEDMKGTVEFEKDDEGVNTAVDTFAVEPDSIWQAGLKGERAGFFTVNKAGKMLTIDRQSVHESLGIEWIQKGT
jgi:hypothetical protein